MEHLERSALVLKPDGIAMGLIPVARNLLEEDAMLIVEEFYCQLTIDKGKSLYAEYSKREYFPELIDFMTSSPLYVFLVEGSEAVKIVRKIIGKRNTSFGLRSVWAKSIIMNVAHGPDSVEAAEREIQIFIGGKV